MALTGAQEWQAANAAFTQLSSLEQAAHCWLMDASRQSRNGSNTINIHGGNNDVFSGNRVDLSTLAQKTLALQTSSGTGCSAGTMSGNTFPNSIIISGGGGGGYNVLSGSPVNAPTIANNAYHNYAGSAISSGGSYSDAILVSEDPQLTCWTYNIAWGH